MSGTPEPADARRALLAKYMRGELPQGALAAGGSIVRRPVRATPSCAPDARVRLVPVQTSGSRRPIFYVHVHIEGGAFYCFTLARDLGSDQPFYALEPYRFDGLRVPPLALLELGHRGALTALVVHWPSRSIPSTFVAVIDCGNGCLH